MKETTEQVIKRYDLPGLKWTAEKSEIPKSTLQTWHKRGDHKFIMVLEWCRFKLGMKDYAE